jgi:hypothetical protein
MTSEQLFELITPMDADYAKQLRRTDPGNWQVRWLAGLQQRLADEPGLVDAMEAHLALGDGP